MFKHYEQRSENKCIIKSVARCIDDIYPMKYIDKTTDMFGLRSKF